MALKDKKARAKYQREYRLAHLAEYQARDKKYRTENPDKLLERNRKYAKNNREKVRAAALRRNRKFRRKHASYYSNYQMEWKKKNPERARAWWKVRDALKRGIIVRPESCSKCGSECKPQAHHPDYSKPLEVVWVCRLCHKKIHLPYL